MKDKRNLLFGKMAVIITEITSGHIVYDRVTLHVLLQLIDNF